MGFPASYAEITLPKPLLYALSSLCFIGNLISALLNLLGLSDFIESDMELVVDPPENCAVCLNEFERGEEI
ncbi:hypothetical protein Goshw_000956, partial [Gossypium schwendimanii]|nr:hypothetical protein [Gossypium schwendimanii]